MGRDSASDAFYERIWPHRADVLRFAHFLTRDSTAAEDVAQETLLKAFKAIGDLEAGSNVHAWLLKIARNTWLDCAQPLLDRGAGSAKITDRCGAKPDRAAYDVPANPYSASS